MLKLQLLESSALFRLAFGSVWKFVENFDLDGHNLGTVMESDKMDLPH